MKKCVYIVEDNTDIREMLEFLLKEEEYEVYGYPNINSFWQQMQNHKPDMIVLDIMLPDGNGLDVCTILKSTAKTHHIPVMLMSANNNLKTVKSRCAAETYINKPFDINDFVRRVDSYCH